MSPAEALHFRAAGRSNTSARGANTRTCERHALSHEFIALHYDLLLSVGSDRGLCLQAVLVALLAGLDQVLRCTLINCMSKLRPISGINH